MNFDLETILGFLFVIFFVVLPIFSKRRKGGQPGQPGQPGGPPTASGPEASGSPRPGGERGAPTASTSANPSAPAKPAPQQAPAAGLQATLDEIRQRVYEAQQQEKASSAAGRATGAGRPAAAAAPASARSTGTKLGGQHSSRSADPFGQGMVSGQYSSHGSGSTASTAQPASSRTQRQRAEAPLGREGRQVSGSIESAAPLEVAKAKRKAQRAARSELVPEAIPGRRERAAGAARLSPAYLGTTRADLVRGMIWHEVLAESVAHRRLRRLRSRPR